MTDIYIICLTLNLSETLIFEPTVQTFEPNVQNVLCIPPEAFD